MIEPACKIPAGRGAAMARVRRWSGVVNATITANVTAGGAEESPRKNFQRAGNGADAQPCRGASACKGSNFTGVFFANRTEDSQSPMCDGAAVRSSAEPAGAARR